MLTLADVQAGIRDAVVDGSVAAVAPGTAGEGTYPQADWPFIGATTWRA